jgi:RNA polymerase sigma factor (sigma-70 family)
MHLLSAWPGRPALRPVRHAVDSLSTLAGRPGQAATAPDRAATPAPAPEGLDRDAPLAAACRRGDPEAMERLVDRFQADVVGTALRLVGDRDSALELATTTFVKLSRSLGSYDPGQPLRPWVLRVATDETLSWLRRRRREGEQVPGGGAGEVALEQATGGPGPAAAGPAAEHRAAVHAALARLQDRDRLVLTLRFFDDLSYAEIAAQTGQDANAVAAQLLRARRRLGDELRRAAVPTAAPPADWSSSA